MRRTSQERLGPSHGLHNRGVEGHLFDQGDMHACLEGQTKALREEVRVYAEAKFLNTAPEDLVAYLFEKYRINPIGLKEDEAFTDKEDGQIDLTGTQRGFLYDDPRRVRCTWVTLTVPYEGDRELFKVRPTAYTLNRTRGAVWDGNVVLREPMHPDTTSEQLKAAFESRLAAIRRDVDQQAKDVAPFNSSLADLARREVEARRKKLLDEQGVLGSLGFAVRRREGGGSYAPDVRRKISVASPPPATSAPYKPEPCLDEGTYGEILAVLQRMAEVMERSPSAFKDLGEEDLRTHFLVQLNGAFESPSTGETFNAGGKTDIFLRADGGNAFVGECKFWGGEKAFGGIVDQLLGYVTWRDTKTAVLLFSRNKGFAEVVAKARAAAEFHPRFKRSLPYLGANGFRGVYGHPDDANREVIVTTIAFDVPS